MYIFRKFWLLAGFGVSYYFSCPPGCWKASQSTAEVKYKCYIQPPHTRHIGIKHVVGYELIF